MANRERVESAVAQGLGYEASSQEVREEVALLVKTIVDGLRKGYKVALVDRLGVEEGTSHGTAFEIVDSTGNPAGSSVSQDILEERAWMFLEENLEMLSGLATDLAFIEGDIKNGQAVQLYFPLDEEE